MFLMFFLSGTDRVPKGGAQSARTPEINYRGRAP